MRCLYHFCRILRRQRRIEAKESAVFASKRRIIHPRSRFILKKQRKTRCERRPSQCALLKTLRYGILLHALMRLVVYSLEECRESSLLAGSATRRGTPLISSDILYVVSEWAQGLLASLWEFPSVEVANAKSSSKSCFVCVACWYLLFKASVWMSSCARNSALPRSSRNADWRWVKPNTFSVI